MKRIIIALIAMSVLLAGCSTVNPESNNKAASDYYESKHEQYEMAQEYEGEIDELKEELAVMQNSWDDLYTVMQEKYGIDIDEELQEYYEKE